jgi:predicted metallo-beta-lactamase superfamily hydrolase
VLIKNPREKINFSQRRRGWVFQKTGGKYAKKLEIADDKSFNFGETKIKFSEPVFHGPEDSALGWILMTTIEFKDEKFLMAPDVQGPMTAQTLKLILREKPQLLMIGGPPLYLAGFRVDEALVQTGLENLGKIVELVPCTILEHHILRSEQWREKAEEVFKRAQKAGNIVLTAAEFLGKENLFLEAKRKTLFAEHPPPKDFEKWTRESLRMKKKTKPPI